MLSLSCHFVLFAVLSAASDELVVEGCPGEIFETLPANSATVQVFWTPPTVSANAVGDVQTFSNFQPGDRFPPGENIVTYTLSDSTGSSGSCSFTVTVEGMAYCKLSINLICLVSSTLNSLSTTLPVHLILLKMLQKCCCLELVFICENELIVVH